MANSILSAPSCAGIYRIRCISNGRFYIDSAMNLRRRMAEHIRKMTTSMHINPKMQASWDKYGSESFVFEVVLFCSAGMLLDYEQRLIDGLDTVKNGFNIAESATSPMLGRRHSAQAIDAIKAARIGQVASAETRSRISKIARENSGKTTRNMAAVWAKRTPEQASDLIKKVAASNTGQKRSQKIVEKFQVVSLALWQDPRHREKMMASHKDRATPVWSAEAKAEHSRRLKEYRASPAGLAHPTNQGRKVTEETRAKMVASAIAREARKKEQQALL